MRRVRRATVVFPSSLELNALMIVTVVVVMLGSIKESDPSVKCNPQ